MFYALFVTFMISGQLTELRWQTYDRLAECLEVAVVITHHRDDIVARCVMVESKP